MSVIGKRSGGSEAADIVVRVASASLGAYAVTYFLAAALTCVFARLGTGRADAVMMASILALFAFPATSLWVFGERRLWAAAATPVVIAVVLALVTSLLRP